MNAPDRFRAYPHLRFGNRSSRNRILLSLRLVCWFNALLIAKHGEAALGDIVAQYGFAASSFAMSPTQPYMYATIPSRNAVAIINTNTLAVENTIFVGSGPANIAFSPDGLTAYIANSTSNFLVVFDTQTRAVKNSLLTPEQPKDVVFGNQNRLFVLGSDSIFQINATTGASAGPSIGSGFIYGGALEISPDRNRLYYADFGLSPSTMYKFNVSTSTPALLLQTPFGTVGSNGQDLTLSHDGSFISYATGSGQNGYQIAKFRTADFASLGAFDTGAYPRQIAFSPDDLVAYTVHTDGQIELFSTNTFLPRQTAIWFLNNASLVSTAYGLTLPAGWTLTGAADLNSDGHTDYFLHNASTRQTAIWYLNGTALTGSALGPALPVGWMLVDALDFNGDGKPDFLLSNSSTRRTAIWYLHNASYSGSAYGPTMSAGWTLQGAADFNGNGKPDYVLFEASTRRTALWYLSGVALSGSAFGPTLPTGYTLASP